MDPRLHTGMAQQGAGYVAWVVNRDGCEAMREKWPLIDARYTVKSEQAARELVDRLVKKWKERADGVQIQGPR